MFTDNQSLEITTVTVVIPALNEAENLSQVLPRIPAWVSEIILVDSNSTDGTVEVARRLCPQIHVIEQERCGKGAALRAGFAAATSDIIVMLDADGSTDPAEMGRFVRELRNDADFVKGSRYIQGGGSSDFTFQRNMGNTVLTMIVRMMFGGRFTDLCYGYNAFWRRVLPKLELDSDGFEIETLMNVRALTRGLKIVEVLSFEKERLHGESKLHVIPDGLRVLRTILVEWLKSRPIMAHKPASTPVTRPSNTLLDHPV